MKGLTSTILGLALAIALSAGVCAQSIKMASGEWAPYTGENLPQQGIATEIVVAACQAAGIQPEFEFVPWLRAEQQLDRGRAFAAFPYRPTVEREAKYDFSEPLFNTSTKFFYHRKARHFDDLKVGGLADMGEFSVVVLAGAWSSQAMQDVGIDVSAASTMDSAIHMLRVGRVDFLVMEQAVVYDAIGKAFPAEVDDFKALPNDFFGTGTARLMVSRSYPDAQALLAKFNAGLKTIRANGTLGQFAKKYRLIVE